MKGQESGIQLKQRLTGSRRGGGAHFSLYRSHQGTAVTAERGQRSQGYTIHFLKGAATVLFFPATHWEYEMRPQ